jgi:hypothetical protein
MEEKDSDDGCLKQNIGEVIDALELSDLQKRFLRSRWLEQLLWQEKKAKSAQKLYYILRLVAIVGGVIVPALVGLKIGDASVAWPVSWVTFVLGLMVAISVSVEEFFHYGERWRHYRRNAELLKMEGWQFFQLAEPYQQFKAHPEAYQEFAGRVEKILGQELDVYIAQIAAEKKEKQEPEKT